MPSACAAMPMRPPSSVDIATLKPPPTSPSSASAGRWTSSRKIWHDLLPRMPSLSSGVPVRTPLVFIGRMNAVMPLWPAALSFIVNSTQTSATGPFVIQFFVPLMTQPSPTARRVVFCAAASLPASGSLSAKQPSSLPLASGVEPLLLLRVGAELD